jgi:hypothetical protein
MAPDTSVNHLADADEIERRLNHRAAHRARMAHRVIRLREVGFEGDLEQLVARRPASGPAGDTGQACRSGAGGLARLIHATLDGADKDRPGPTDLVYAKKLFTLDRSDLFAEWKENADEAAEDFDRAGALEAAESQERDREAAARHPSTPSRPPSHGDVTACAVRPARPDGEWAANALYDLGREGFLAGEIDWDTAVIKVDLVDTGAYTIDLATHKFRSSHRRGRAHRVLGRARVEDRRRRRGRCART